MGICGCCASIRSAFSAVASGVVDFKGQERVYSVLVYLAWLGGLGGFAAGALFEDFSITTYAIFLCMGLAAVLCIPSWPAYHRHPVEWTPHDPVRLAALYTQQQEQSASQQKPAGRGKGAKAKKQ
ncbi:microsomal signal peptidase (spc12) domain-containing protein [Besnoitia besnoiti]|uniref:Signal peptidase complex subunit 1 n=1 Tax=Besnoitia besnoiti TaxID=94643 RepID=A0A2A9M995_BESBE|nr:microsomal signal peptidase (spc12) domain-containing protein [Besnoitia besnoiti]PFH31950.1 microsomal signal peptidase (spc12) domain-containing protein [Besnoitia besnoiti]